MGILPEERDDFSYLKPSASVPTFIGRVMSHSLLGEPLIPPMRRVSTTDKLFTQHKDSPLFDLPPLALPGLTSRVSRNNSVARSLELLDQAFLPPGAVDEDELIAVEGGFSLKASREMQGEPEEAEYVSNEEAMAASVATMRGPGMLSGKQVDEAIHFGEQDDAKVKMMEAKQNLQNRRKTGFLEQWHAADQKQQQQKRQTLLLQQRKTKGRASIYG